MSWMQTYRGHRFDFGFMHREPLDIEDIAHALSQVCRFGGHCREFYSVAQHSVYVSQLVNPEHRLTALLHDATEAYMGDMVSPLKRRITEYQQHEQWLWMVISRQFGLPMGQPDEVRRADLVMLAAEARDLCNADVSTWGLAAAPESIRIHPWPPKVAERHFLDSFAALTGAASKANEKAEAA